MVQVGLPKTKYNTCFVWTPNGLQHSSAGWDILFNFLLIQTVILMFVIFKETCFTELFKIQQGTSFTGVVRARINKIFVAAKILWFGWFRKLLVGLGETRVLFVLTHQHILTTNATNLSWGISCASFN